MQSSTLFEKLGRLEKELQRLKVEAYFSLPKKRRISGYSERAILAAANSAREAIWRSRYEKTARVS